MKSRTKRVSLVKKEENPLSSILSIKPLFYSGFCLTDNQKFAFFYADTKIFVDNISVKSLNRFKLNEADLDMEINREIEVIPNKGVKKVSFSDIGQIDRVIFNTMKNIYPDCVFHQLKTFFGQAVNSMIIVLHEEKGKPVGLLKTH